MRYVVAVDLGTTRVKAALYDERGALLVSDAREQTLILPEEHHVEQHPSAWYEVPAALIEGLVRGAAIDPADVLAIGISSQGISFVPVDERFSPLCNAISWLDDRADVETAEVASAIPREELFSITGKPLSPAYVLPKLLWLRRHRPALFERASTFLMPLEYLTARLCGQAVTDPTMAGGTMLADLHGRWSERIADAFSLSIGKLPRVVPAGSVAGALTPEAARRTGLTCKTLVAVGAQDQKIAAYGAGISEGAATLSLGTAGAIEFLASERGGVLPAFPFIDGRRVVMEGCVNTFGAAINWARDLLTPSEGYEEWNNLAASAPIGSHGAVFRPFLSGAGTPHEGTELVGAWDGLTLHTGKSEMARAVYEGLACEIRLNVDAARAAGVRVEALRAFGGGTGSALLLQMIANLCELPVSRCERPEMALEGAARIAARAAGLDERAFGAAEGSSPIIPLDVDAHRAVYARYTAAGH